ncbi:SIR2 family histone deacetylase [Rickenella mellea]|uniref:NAD-dependent protein deacetylase n=1 Tax=Rickenella mellea TaxID=50990 RepID=A0A4Y7Q3D6_9AGAM|nr:SIR2 family histone deacetylase [Rickenella mellea]
MWKVSSLLHKDEIPQILDSLDVDGIAKYMKSDVCKNVFIMAGAGISTSAGIPDFRSPDTGLYANLARLKLPYPEAVFDISYFRKNPRPFYTLARELAPGQFRPSPAHSFIRLLAEKKLLRTCFTQNIDTLERRAGVPASMLVEAHGSFAEQHCIECHAEFPGDKIRTMIEAQEIPRCERKGCGGLVKPDIVFFGESLPPEFFKQVPKLRDADLLIVMGTSLTVHPFASLTGMVPEECPRLLINLDHVGGWGSRVNDVAILQKCDDAVRLLCKRLGWEDELEGLWEETAELVKQPTSSPKSEPSSRAATNSGVGQQTEEEKLKSEVDKLTEEIEQTLNLSAEHQSAVRDEIKASPEDAGEKGEQADQKSPISDSEVPSLAEVKTDVAEDVKAAGALEKGGDNSTDRKFNNEETGKLSTTAEPGKL